MKTLLQLLAISAGGGLLVGVGIRLAENRGSEDSPASSPESGGRISSFVARLEALEKRAAAENKSGSFTAAGAAGRENTAPDKEASAPIETQLAAIETRLRQSLDRRHQDSLGRMSDVLEKRLAERIAPIEAEIESQRAAVGELREFSLRTEMNLQKLLEGIEKLVASRTF